MIPKAMRRPAEPYLERSVSAKLEFLIRTIFAYTASESATTTNKEASANRATNSNHVQVTRFEGLVELIALVCLCPALERFRGNSHASPETESVVRLHVRAFLYVLPLFRVCGTAMLVNLHRLVVPRESLLLHRVKVSNLELGESLVPCALCDNAKRPEIACDVGARLR